MALVKPLKIVNGVISQFTSSDTLDAAIVEKDVVELTNSDGLTYLAGVLVYKNSLNNGFGRAQNGIPDAFVLGILVTPSVAPAATGTIQTDGIVSIADWTAGTGSASLVAGSQYYLNPALPGRMTTTLPTNPGQYIVRIGVAISTTDFEISIQPPILL